MADNTDQQFFAPSARAVTLVSLRHPLLMGRSEQIRFDRVQVIIQCRDDTGFLHDLAVVVIHGLEMLGPIHDRR